LLERAAQRPEGLFGGGGEVWRGGAAEKAMEELRVALLRH